MKKYCIAVLFVFAMTGSAMAKTDINIGGLGQDMFKSFSTDFGMAVSYQAMAPAAPLGGLLPGFDAGVEASVVQLDKSASYWQKLKDATGSDLPNTLIFPRIHVQVGLPVIPLDLGVSYTSVPDSDIKLTGLELKYAVFEGGLAMPAVAVRGAYTKLSGLKQLDIETKSVDLSISKGIIIFTPYIGAGQVWITSTPIGNMATLLKEEEITQTKIFVGTKMKIFPFVNLVAQGDFSTVQEYSLRLNVNF